MHNTHLLLLLLEIHIFKFLLDVFPTVIQKMIPTSMTQSVRTVKILAIKSIGPNMDQVVGFLRCFPCTEKLLVEVKLLSYKW